MRVGVIINPVSGRLGRRPSAGQERAALAAAFISKTCRRADVRLTRGAGDAAVLAHALIDAGCDRIVAWGGDGTINEAAGPLIGSQVTLGIVRSGSGDGFARSLGLPREPEAAWTIALQSSHRAIDVGRIGDRHFLNIAGVGFDATVGLAFNRRARRGPLGYLAAGLPLLRGYRAAHYLVDLDGDVSTGRWFLIAFANGREYGNGAVLDAGADVADGWLNAVLVSDAPMWRQVWRARRLSFRRDRPADGIQRRRIHQATVTGEQLICHADGETFETRGMIDVSLRAGALRVAAPEPQPRARKHGSHGGHG
jgi:diacylglycerol kinase family enzyme